jgi:hypothetical protein
MSDAEINYSSQECQGAPRRKWSRAQIRAEIERVGAEIAEISAAITAAYPFEDDWQVVGSLSKLVVLRSLKRYWQRLGAL